MKTILVDDMLLDLQLFELKCADMPDFEIVGKFTDPQAAIEYASGHVVDFALLDIDMPGMDGIQLAQALRRLRSDIIIVFATAHPKFAVEALKMKADYIIFKPFDREDIADVMERAKLLRRRQRKRIHFHTFGAFDMLVDGEPVRFRSAKAKELMAVHPRDRGESLGGERRRRRLPPHHQGAGGHPAGLRRGGDVPAQPGQPAGADGSGGFGLSGFHGRR